MNTFPNWIQVNVVRRGHHFKSRCAAGNGALRPLTGLNVALSLRPAISWSIMPLNTLFCHLFCAPAVMHGMPRGYDTEEGDRCEREAEESVPNLGWPEATLTVTLSARVSCYVTSAMESQRWQNFQNKSLTWQVLWLKPQPDSALRVNHRHSKDAQLWWWKFYFVK